MCTFTLSQSRLGFAERTAHTWLFVEEAKVSLLIVLKLDSLAPQKPRLMGKFERLSLSFIITA